MTNLNTPRFFSLFGAAFIVKTTALIALACLFMAPLSAQNDPKISIQGTLKSANGLTVADGNYDVRFNLYDVTTGGTALWFEDASVEVVGGIYSHYLGTTTPLNPTDFAKTLYLGVKVGNYELVPRTELSYAPYAFSVAFAQSALSAEEVVCSGAVGDIKYSILDPAQFAQVNGDCWIPMDGRSISGSELANRGISSIPNAGGLFMRAHEFGTHNTATSNNDPDRPANAPIATVQQDDVKPHNHPDNFSIANDGAHTHGYLDKHINDNLSSNPDPYAEGDGTTEIDSNRSTSSAGNHSHNINGGVQNSTGSETRPKNLNFWIYIRIN